MLRPLGGVVDDDKLAVPENVHIGRADRLDGRPGPVEVVAVGKADGQEWFRHFESFLGNVHATNETGRTDAAGITIRASANRDCPWATASGRTVTVIQLPGMCPAAN